MHLRQCMPPIMPVRIDEMKPIKMTDGSVAEAFEQPVTDEYFERVTQPDGRVRWYRIVSDGVVTV